LTELIPRLLRYVASRKADILIFNDTDCRTSTTALLDDTINGSYQISSAAHVGRMNAPDGFAFEKQVGAANGLNGLNEGETCASAPVDTSSGFDAACSSELIPPVSSGFIGSASPPSPGIVSGEVVTSGKLVTSGETVQRMLESL
jgi:hypothetical protein